MQQYVKIFFVGMLVSFLGSLPLGTLNVAAMQISIADGYRAAIEFAIGVFIIEMGYVRLSLVAMDKIRKQQKILQMLEWVTLFIIVALAVSSFIAASKNNPHAKNVLLNSLPRFFLGVVMSALNPVQIPFWFGWSTVLFTKKVLQPRNDHYNMYIAGIGIGTFLATCIFIFSGRIFVEKLNANQNVLNWIIGGIFSVTALIQLWKMLRKKDLIHQMNETR
jgi:threonine/homoserine/homoserine lactone efflux protein